MSPGAKAPGTTADRAGEKASPVYAVLENPSMIDFPGHLCGVFFVSGCNFSCGFCHNALLMGQPQPGLSWNRLDKICERMRRQWADAVCLTGGEPTLSEELPLLIGYFRRAGFLVKLDTNGSRPDVLRDCLPLVDCIAMDVKAGLSGYPKLTGFHDTGKISESIELIMGSGTEYEFRTTLISSFHTDEQLLEIGGMIRGAKRFCLQPFIPQDTLPDPALRAEPRTSPQRLREAGDLLRPFVQNLQIRGA